MVVLRVYVGREMSLRFGLEKARTGVRYVHIDLGLIDNNRWIAK